MSLPIDPIECGKLLAEDSSALWTLSPRWDRLWFQLRRDEEVVGYYHYFPTRNHKIALYGPQYEPLDLMVVPFPAFNRICRQVGSDSAGCPVFDAEPQQECLHPGDVLYSEGNRRWLVRSDLDDTMTLIADKWWAEREFEMGMEQRRVKEDE